MAFTPLAPDFAATRIGPQGGPFLSGDVPIIGGVGVAERINAAGDGLVLDAPVVKADAPAGLFVPAVASWPATTLALPGNIRLRLAEALIAGTAPAAGTDTDNCHALRVSGTESGQQDLKLSTPAGRAYRFDAVELAQVLGAQDNHFNAATAGIAHVQPFEPTADLTAVSYLAFYSIPANGLDWVNGQPYRYVICNADRTAYLAVTDFDDTVPPAEGFLELPLLASVDLEQGTRYWIGLEIDDATDQSVWAADASTPNWTGSIGPSAGAENLFGTAADGATALTASRSVAAADATDGPYAIELKGTAGSVLITGALVVEFIAVGAPPNDPDELNVRLQWAAEA